MRFAMALPVNFTGERLSGVGWLGRRIPNKLYGLDGVRIRNTGSCDARDRNGSNAFAQLFPYCPKCLSRQPIFCRNR